jgi:hypothetical protein
MNKEDRVYSLLQGGIQFDQFNGVSFQQKYGKNLPPSRGIPWAEYEQLVITNQEHKRLQ